MKWVWLIFLMMVVLEFFKISNVLFLIFSGLLLILHIRVSLGWKKGTILLILACGIGFLAEAISLAGGTIFGGRYVYHMGYGSFLSVPWPVILYWGVFIYTGYFIARVLNGGKWNVWGESVMVAGIVTSIDLFMDPLMVARGYWVWFDGGSYFGVPWGNFAGWFGVTLLVILIFRMVQPENDLHQKDKQIFLVPIIGYFCLWMENFITGMKLGMWNLILIGSLLMLPIGGVGLLRYSKMRGSRLY